LLAAGLSLPRRAGIVAALGVGDEDFAMEARALELFDEARGLVDDVVERCRRRRGGAQPLAVRAIDLAALPRLDEARAHRGVFVDTRAQIALQVGNALDVAA